MQTKVDADMLEELEVFLAKDKELVTQS
jgi:hypothetical protein